MANFDADEFLATGDSRETDSEIMRAIAGLAGNEAEAVRIWEEPTDEELLSIAKYVTNNYRLDTTDFCWGAAGEKWALA